MLMEDHAISPELVAKCGTDIDTNCKGFQRSNLRKKKHSKDFFFFFAI